LKVTTKSRDDHQVELTLTLDSKELERAKRRIARAYAKRMRISGFRPGKAPYEVVARKVGEEALEQEALEALLDEYYPKALEEADIDPYGPGTLEEIVSTDPPEFRLLVPLQADVDLGDYRSVRVPYEPPEVSDEDVDTALNTYRSMFAVLEPVDRPAEVGDVVYVNVEAYEEGQEDGEPLFADQNHPLLIEEEPHEYEWPYPGFPEAFLGAKAGDTKTLVYTYPEDDGNEDLRGKTVVFKAEVTEVKGRALPELDDDFAKQLGDFETMDEVRDVVREEMLQQQRAAYDAEYLEQVLDAILAQATLKYPPQMVDEEVENLLDEHKHRAEQTGQTWEEYLDDLNMDEEELRANLREEAEDIARRRLVLSTIAEQENLEVDENQVVEQTRQNLAQMLAFMDRKEARRLARDRKFVQDVLLATTMDALLTQAEEFVIALGKGELDEQAEAEDAEEEKLTDDAVAQAVEAAEAQAEAEAEAETEPATEAEAAEEEPASASTSEDSEDRGE